MEPLQALPQLMPPKSEVTVPVPVPALVTVRGTVGALPPNVAVTVLSLVIVTEHVGLLPQVGSLQLDR
jgi:hypothetical protein